MGNKIFKFERTGLIQVDMVIEVNPDRGLDYANAYSTMKKRGYGIYFSEGDYDVFTMHGDMQLPCCVTSWAVIHKIH